MAFKICQNPFSAGALPRTPLGELTTLPETLYSAGEGTPLPIPHPTRHGPTFGARHASPQKSSQIYAYANTHVESAATGLSVFLETLLAECQTERPGGKKIFLTFNF